MGRLVVAAVVGAAVVGGILALADRFLDITVCDDCEGCNGCEGCDGDTNSDEQTSNDTVDDGNKQNNDN